MAVGIGNRGREGERLLEEGHRRGLCPQAVEFGARLRGGVLLDEVKVDPYVARFSTGVAVSNLPWGSEDSGASRAGTTALGPVAYGPHR